MFDAVLGPNAPLIGAPAERFARDAATPILCIDKPVFERNIAAMQAAADGWGVALRPHMKGHKSTHIARAQLAAGAIGICCATAKEVAVAVSAGVRDILMTTPATSPMVLAHLAGIAKAVSLTLVFDTPAGLALAAAAARDANATFGALIDIDVGQHRTGLASPAAAVAFASLIAEQPGLRLRGVQAYYGHLQHVATLAERRQRVAEQCARIREVVDTLRAAGRTMDIVSGGGTGTAELDREAGLFTELQPGSYPFMDSQYLDVERSAVQLEPALTVLARVTSDAVPGQVVIDAGTKALATDAARFRLAAPDLPGVTHRFMGDEHSALVFADSTARPAVGTLVSLVATHCDPTVNLHQRFHVMEAGRLVDIWPIEARGY